MVDAAWVILPFAGGVAIGLALAWLFRLRR